MDANGDYQKPFPEDADNRSSVASFDSALKNSYRLPSESQDTSSAFNRKALSTPVCHVWLANCYFAHDSLGFPILLPSFDGQSGRSFYPLDRHHGPVARTGWGPFRSCGVPSPQAPTPDRESLPPSRTTDGAVNLNLSTVFDLSCCCPRPAKGGNLFAWWLVHRKAIRNC
jgi:hypothetical protein